eukprot:TRINITY_DN8093_c0_g2_i3.p2 TRINITY_DN8093_c0_g2~~TRINITY_DN8093_c0_g2_i3.p2  ORF type:complete len:160 (+),score=8.24 TRINITY_DN8093_c0_g2_i3:100-579(+)
MRLVILTQTVENSCYEQKALLSKVSKNSIWTEHCKKETKALKLNQNFAVTDFRKVGTVTEKVNHVTPKSVSDATMVQEAEKRLQSLSNTKNFNPDSVDGLNMSITESQEYGLYRNNKFKEYSPMFTHPRGTCDVTQYADAYVSMSGTSPYKRKEIGATS